MLGHKERVELKVGIQIRIRIRNDRIVGQDRIMKRILPSARTNDREVEWIRKDPVPVQQLTGMKTPTDGNHG